MTHGLEHTDHTVPTRSHDLDYKKSHTDHIDHTIYHTNHTNRPDHAGNTDEGYGDHSDEGSIRPQSIINLFNRASRACYHPSHILILSS